jgi:thiol:disulfide interchange protein
MHVKKNFFNRLINVKELAKSRSHWPGFLIFTPKEIIMKRTAFLILFLTITGSLMAQIENPVSWKFGHKKTGPGEYELSFTAIIQPGWHMYGLNIPSGPTPTSFNFEERKTIEFVGKLETRGKPVIKKDPFFNVNVEFYETSAVFVRKVRILSSGPDTVRGSIELQSCDDSQCKYQDEEFTFILPGESTAVVSSANPMLGDSSFSEETLRAAAGQQALTGKIQEQGKTSGNLWSYFLIAFLAGLGGILTPCVYPMIPMTVSFFMRGQDNRAMAMLNGIVFGLSIIIIYTLFGVIVSLTSAGADFANQLNSHWIPNSLFFLLFIVFAASFFGMFELILPASMSNKVDQMADRGGILGAFFMALTLVIVSFSCTGPIVGGLLVEAAGGLALKPILGMFGFSLAFALPFSLFAIFPSLLKSLPKSGGWLNSVKVVLGFVMLAFSLKFLSNMNESYHLGIIGREVYLAIWIVLFTLLGFYLLGKIQFAHDSEVKYVSVPRLILAIASFVFVVYLIPGMFGAPLRAVSSLIPPAKGHSFDLIRLISENRGAASATENNITGCETPRFGDKLELPYNLHGYFDYKQGIACAKAQGKPVFLDFKGHTCSNCKKMENEVWSDPRVQQRLRDNFVIIALYVDDREELPESEWLTSAFDGKVKKTLGKVNADRQITMFNSNTQPLYAITDADGRSLITPVGVELNVERYLQYLDKGAAEFKSRQKP